MQCPGIPFQNHSTVKRNAVVVLPLTSSASMTDTASQTDTTSETVITSQTAKFSQSDSASTTDIVSQSVINYQTAEASQSDSAFNTTTAFRMGFSLGLYLGLSPKQPVLVSLSLPLLPTLRLLPPLTSLTLPPIQN